MPMLHAGGDVHDIARQHLLRRLTPFLIVAAATHADQHLSATLIGVVHVPVVATPWLEGYVRGRNLLGCKGCKPALATEILRVGIVRLAHGEHQCGGEGCQVGIGVFCELGCEIVQGIAPRCLFDHGFLLLCCVSRMDAVPYAARNPQPMEPFLTMTIVLLELWFKSRFLLCLCKFALQKFYAPLV